jgi:predicted transposase YbfD/YdcC
VILQEHVVGDKENEVSRMQEFLTPQLLTGRIVTADALHTQRAFCLGVVHAGGDYLLIAKGNQPDLQEALHTFFREPPLDCHDWPTAHTCNSGQAGWRRAICKPPPN